MIRIYRQNGGELPFEEAREALSQAEGDIWVDVDDAGPDDWQRLVSLFGFHPLALEDAQKKNQRPKADNYIDYLFLTVRAWVGAPELTDDLTGVTDEIDLFLGPRYLVTIRGGQCQAVTEPLVRWRRGNTVQHGAAFGLYMVLDWVVDAYFPVMDAIDEKIDDLERSTYLNNSLDIDVGEALLLKKELLLLRQTVAPTRDILNQLLRLDEKLIARGNHAYFQDVYDHTLRLLEQVDLHRDILTGVMDAMTAQVNNRLSQVMKTLTAVSTILMSCSLVAGIYGMSFRRMPELEWAYGYPAALGIMLVICLILVYFFRRIRWF